MSKVEQFLPLILQQEEIEQAPTPVISTDDGVTFLYVKYNNLYSKSTKFKIIYQLKKSLQ